MAVGVVYGLAHADQLFEDRVQLYLVTEELLHLELLGLLLVGAQLHLLYELLVDLQPLHHVLEVNLLEVLVDGLVVLDKRYIFIIIVVIILR